MFPWQFYFLLFTLLWFDLSGGDEVGKRIIGGKDAPANKFPWAVSIRGAIPGKEGSTTVCGATIINNQWLLTAAHCFYTKINAEIIEVRDPKYWHIIAGQVFVDDGRYREGHKENLHFHQVTETLKTATPTKLNQRNIFKDFKNRFVQLFRELIETFTLFEERNKNERASQLNNKEDHFHVDKIILHPKYKQAPNFIEWDIALMKLNKAIPNITGVKSVSLPNSYQKNRSLLPRDKEKCIIVGWGCIKGGGNAIARAQFTQLEVVNFDKCNKAYNGRAGLNKEHEFCAGFINKDIGICPGDSGGGLICSANSKYYVAGVTSATHRDRPGSYPGLFARVSYFIDWIDKTMSVN